ncbi:MAG: CorA family divalent cation transporter [Hyphomonadaceae bacterium]|nr:CorA family divalent cation transporter [Hyphomonadaceae bacterium]
MLRIRAPGGVECVSLDDPRALWIDLESPTDEEERAVEAALEVDVLTAAERAALEESARFYQENGALYLTATLLGRRDEGPFKSGAVTFILTKGKLVTVRTIRPRAFDVGQGRASARVGSATTGAEVMMALLDGGVERLADILSEATQELTKLSTEIFAEKDTDLRGALRSLGRVGGLVSMTHECLSSLQRLAVYARHAGKDFGFDNARLGVFARDTEELERVAEALQTRLSYYQDAALGFISSTQNDVLRTLAIATMAFMPPTLIASIFGMNFQQMTWFDAAWGPWVGMALMVLAPLALFAVAKWRRWF